MGHSARILAYVTAALCAGGGGCASNPQRIRTALSQSAPAQAAQTLHAYTLACPDQLAVQVSGRPDLSRAYAVEPDGCICLANMPRLRVEGATADQVEHGVGTMLHMPASAIRVQVTAFASRKVLLLGPTRGAQRVVPYQGPETVVDLLRRTGGFDSGAAFDSVHVVRPLVAEGRRPQVFPVDLHAIVVGNDSRSNVVLEPNDEVFLVETQRATVARALPPWFRAIWPGPNCVDPALKLGDNY